MVSLLSVQKHAALNNFKGRNRFLLSGGNNQRKSSSYNTVPECKSRYCGTSAVLPEFTIPLNLSISLPFYLHNITTHGKYSVLKIRHLSLKLQAKQFLLTV